MASKILNRFMHWDTKAATDEGAIPDASTFQIQCCLHDSSHREHHGAMQTLRIVVQEGIQSASDGRQMCLPSLMFFARGPGDVSQSLAAPVSTQLHILYNHAMMLGMKDIWSSENIPSD
jgi:hypothetical protein